MEEEKRENYTRNHRGKQRKQTKSWVKKVTDFNKTQKQSKK